MKLTLLLLVCLACVKPSVERAAGYSKFDKGKKKFFSCDLARFNTLF